MFMGGFFCRGEFFFSILGVSADAMDLGVDLVIVCVFFLFVVVQLDCVCFRSGLVCVCAWAE